MLEEVSQRHCPFPARVGGVTPSIWEQGRESHQSVAKLVTHSAKFWNFLDERRTTAKKNYVCQISPLPPNQC